MDEEKIEYETETAESFHIDFDEDGPDLAPGFFSSYGYEEPGGLIIHEPETGRRYIYLNDGSKKYID